MSETQEPVFSPQRKRTLGLLQAGSLIVIFALSTESYLRKDKRAIVENDRTGETQIIMENPRSICWQFHFSEQKDKGTATITLPKGCVLKP